MKERSLFCVLKGYVYSFVLLIALLLFHLLFRVRAYCLKQFLAVWVVKGWARVLDLERIAMDASQYRSN